MTKKFTRREFIEQTTVTVAAAAALPAASANAANLTEPTAAKLPQRTLGRTGASVPILAFGCGSRFLMYDSEEEALRILNHVIDQGITYLDTAMNYGRGLSETRVGKVVRARRGEVWLATKVPENARTRDAALREVEASLKRLQTNQVDLLHIHSLGGEDDLARVEASNGVLKALYELREQKVARFIGMTSHTDGAVLAKAIRRHDIDCVQMAMNPAQANNFEQLALPAAREKNLGVILMKVTAQEKLLGRGPGTANVDALLRYALSLPIATAVIGMPKPEHIAGNLATVRNLKPMSGGEMESLRRQVASQQARVEHFFLHHQDGQLA